VSDIPENAVLAAEKAIGMHMILRESPEQIARAALEAAAPVLAAQLLDALAAIREAISIPHPATAGDRPRHDEILNMRVMHAKVFLESIADRTWDIGRSIAYFRERLAECPAEGYQTWNDLVAERHACEMREDSGRGH
jgi:hypothetical protein